MGVDTISRVVRHRVSEEMTFKPRPKSRKGAAIQRSGGRAFWTESIPPTGTKVPIWEKFGTEKEEKERSDWLECRYYKMRLQRLHFSHHSYLSETSSFSSTIIHIHLLALFRKPFIFPHKTKGREAWRPGILVPMSSFTGIYLPEFLMGKEALQTQHQVFWRWK